MDLQKLSIYIEQQYFSEIGDLVADEKMHRFPITPGAPEELGYYVCFQRHTVHSGEPYWTIVFGNISDEKTMQDFCTNSSLSFSDREIFNKDIKKAKKIITKSIEFPEPERPKADPTAITALGYNESDYYFVSNINLQIQKISAASMTGSGLCRLQPLSHWETYYPGGKGVDWHQAANDLMQACHVRGIFRPKNVRGRGVWRDQDRIIYHRGICLVVDGEEIPLHDSAFKTKYIYELSDEMPPLHPEPLTLEECQSLLDIAVSICWKKQESFKFFAGWLAMAPLGAAFSWRPHLWLTGATDSGKSYAINSVAKAIIGDYALDVRGASTEAGIRQETGNSTRPILFDEFETNDDSGANRIRNILELFRQASSDSDGVVAKGTVSGKAMEFRPQFCALVGSVRLNLVHVEDQNRFTVLDLEKPKTRQSEQFEQLLGCLNKIGPDYGRRLFSRMFRNADAIHKSLEAFKKVICEKHPTRTANQYGTLLAGYWMLQSDSAATVEDARKLCAVLSFEQAKESEERKDEVECLDALLEKQIRYGTDNISIIELLVRVRENQPGQHLEFLQRHGIVIHENFVCIAHKHESVSEIYRNHPKWRACYAKTLSRIPGAKLDSTQIWFSVLRKQIRCIRIPVSVIFQTQQN